MVRTSKRIGVILSFLLLGAFIFGYVFRETGGGTGFAASKTKKKEDFEKIINEEMSKI